MKRMKLYPLFVSLLCSSGCGQRDGSPPPADGGSAETTAAAPPGDWVVSAGGSDCDSAGGVAVDERGDIYVTGAFVGEADFGQTRLESAAPARADLFVAKLDRKGRFVWATSAGTDGRGNAVAIGAAGDLYVSGFFSGTADFGDGDPVSTPARSAVFPLLAGLDRAGARRFVARVGGDGGTATTVTVDSAGGVVFGGTFEESLVLDGHLLTSGGQSNVFVARYSRAGALQWVVAPDGSDAGETDRLELAQLSAGGGTLELAGAIAGRYRFGQRSLLGASGVGSAFVASFRLATRQFTDAIAFGIGASATAVAVDSAGLRFAAGHFSGSLELAPLVAAGASDHFVVALAKGTPGARWALAGGGEGAEDGALVASAPDGSLRFAGEFLGKSRFHSASGGAVAASAPVLTSAGDRDIIIGDISSAGSLGAIRRAGGASFDRAHALSVGPDGEAVVVGTFSGTASFGDSTRRASGRCDLFVWRSMPHTGRNDQPPPQ